MEKQKSQRGVSLVELVFVLVIVGILTTFAVMAYSSSRKHAADDQARHILDMLDEARQKALNQRNTMRVEINKTKKKITLIDEEDWKTVTDDRVVRSMPLSSNAEVGAAPNNVSAGPTATSPIPVPTYTASTYPLSSGDQKITLRFRRDGQVVDAGTNETGAGSLVTGATVYVYNKTPTGNNPDVVRAVTVLGSTGETSIYRCRVVSGTCTNWAK